MKKYSFPPIADQNSRILLLGSLPGDKSIQAGQYYAHPQNRFWHLLSDSRNFLPDCSYEEKAAYLLQKRIALWDVLECADRPGSSDSKIREAKPNDLDSFFKDYPAIHTVFFNGGEAKRRFERCFPQWARQKTCICLPSSSPANQTRTFEAKKAEWNRIFKTLE